MNLRLLHRRLAVLMGLAGLVAFAGGAGFEPISSALAFGALTLALFWQPSPARARRLERLWLPVATVLVLRALYHVFVIRGDVVIPVVDLLLLLMAAEALRALEAPNDLRLYALSFALVLASTAYRPGVVFLLAFVAYVALSTVALMVGHLRRSAERHRVREVPLGSSLLGATAGLSAFVLAVAVVVFLTFPRVSQGWSGRGDAAISSIAGFSDEVSLGQHGSTIAVNPEIVLRVEFPDGPPASVGGLHWRGRSYDHFDGVRWSRSRALPPSSAPRSWYRNRWDGETITQRIFGAALEARVLFALHPALDIAAENGMQPLFDNAGDFLYWGSVAPVYTVRSMAARPPASMLREADDGFTPPARYFLQLPDDLDPRIRALADSLTAGLETRWDKAVAIERWLGTLGYTRTLPGTAAETSLDHFLFERREGHCEYFSTAMVVLLRAAGIEARNVNGFLGGEWSEFGNYLAVTQNSAHSWAEVWFPGYGWVTFDPTPAATGPGTASAVWFWPGRILFDGIQHRWNKWVLDYGPEEQTGILASWSDLMAREEARSGGGGGAGDVGEGGFEILVGLAVLGLALAWIWRRRTGAALGPAQRAYVKLRRACEGAGLPVTPGLTSGRLVELVQARRPAAAGPSARVVALYERDRWGGRPLDPADLAELRRALAGARRLLRRERPWRTKQQAGVRGGSDRISS